jgi:hypothetical protein
MIFSLELRAIFSLELRVIFSFRVPRATLLSPYFAR